MAISDIDFTEVKQGGIWSILFKVIQLTLSLNIALNL